LTRTEPEALTPMPGGWLAIIDKMLDKGVGADLLTKVFEMQREWEKESARREFVADFSAFKAEAPPSIERTGHVGYQSKKDSTNVDYDHVELDHAVDKLVPWLSKHSLAHSWETDQAENGQISVTCRLEHAAGHSRTVTLRSMPDGSGSKNSIQAIGSAVYYLQRYTLMAILGIAQKYEDDDGKKTGVISPDQVGEINTILDQISEASGVETKLGPVLKFALEKDTLDKDDNLGIIPARRFEAVMAQLRLQLKAYAKRAAK
jgi:hypothetical protein